MMARPIGTPNLVNQQDVIDICTKCNLPSKTCNKRCHHFESEYKRLMEEAKNARKQQRNPV